MGVHAGKTYSYHAESSLACLEKNECNYDMDRKSDLR